MSTATPPPTMSLRARWGRDLVFHLAGVAMATLGVTLWMTSVFVSLWLAITYFGLVLALWTLLACRWFARVERRRAGIVLGEPIAERYAPLAAGRWTTRLHALIGLRTTWRDFAWTGLSGFIAMTLSSLAVTLWGLVLGLVTLPAWYWSLPDGADVGLTGVDTLGASLAAAVVGLALVPVAGWISRGLAIAELAWMRWLLAPRAAEEPARSQADDAAAPAARAFGPRAPLAPPLPLHVSFSVLAGAVVFVIWVVAGLGYFWPVWVWFGLAIAVALHVLALRAARAQGDPVAALRVKTELCGVIAAICWIIWALAGGGYLWPIWPMLGMGTALAARAMYVHRDRLPWAREQALAERVDVLTRTRRGALDVQAAELRRIERDLHDGAQARLVALTMQLGRAEERVADQPEVAALLRRAREDAGLAIAELRDLARGIAPPILADRGLAAAIEALGRRSAIPVIVDVDADRRPLPVVETAAYFVVAEALTNVAKHAGGAAARVAVRVEGDRLVVEVADDGPGGADASGGGLQGLRHRVEALDGTLTVMSPPGAGTTVRAELPCGP
ncbi:MAG TPA: sensor domain-containing protein [Solirubrobacteraceae bacterium]|nr:sensor domain-containing protein [Solirubrobacteraceae bacterium]